MVIKSLAKVVAGFPFYIEDIKRVSKYCIKIYTYLPESNSIPPEVFTSTFKIQDYESKLSVFRNELRDLVEVIAGNMPVR